MVLRMYCAMSRHLIGTKIAIPVTTNEEVSNASQPAS